jgi:hypothetical protein
MALALGLLLAPAAGWVHAQDAAKKADAPLSRAQVKMERDEFLRTHRWDEAQENWVLKSGMEPPAGVKARAEVKAERDQFLRNNKWDEATSAWVPLAGTPRDMGAMTREQVRNETRQFMRTHRWDEATQGWVDKPAAKKKS